MLGNIFDAEKDKWHVEWPNGRNSRDLAGLGPDSAVLIILAAGKGKRLRVHPVGRERNKLLMPVRGKAILRHVVNAASAVPDIREIIVAVTDEAVMAETSQIKECLNNDVVYACGINPQGGTGYAAMQARLVAGLADSDAVCLVTGGDKPGINEETYRKMLSTYRERGEDLLFLTARYDPDCTRKGRVVRGVNDHKVKGIIETNQIEYLLDTHGKDARLPLQQVLLDPVTQDDGSTYTPEALSRISECNLSMYAISARRLFSALEKVGNENAVSEYYLTNIIDVILKEGGSVHALEGSPEEGIDINSFEDYEQYVGGARGGS